MNYPKGGRHDAYGQCTNLYGSEGCQQSSKSSDIYCYGLNFVVDGTDIRAVSLHAR